MEKPSTQQAVLDALGRRLIPFENTGKRGLTPPQLNWEICLEHVEILGASSVTSGHEEVLRTFKRLKKIAEDVLQTQPKELLVAAIDRAWAEVSRQQPRLDADCRVGPDGATDVPADSFAQGHVGSPATLSPRDRDLAAKADGTYVTGC